MTVRTWTIRLLGLIAIGALVASCGSSSTVVAEPSDPDDAAAASSSSGDATSDEACAGSSGPSDLWPDLDTTAPEFADAIRSLTGGLTTVNSFSCEAMVQVEPSVSARDLGASDVASVEHADPYFRIDLVAFDSADGLNAVGGRDAIAGLLTADLSDDSNFEVATPRPYLLMVTTWVDPDGTAAVPNDGLFAAPESLLPTFEVAAYYQQQVFGSD